MTHTDDRRTLEDWPEAKIITTKKDCVLGDHFHRIKTEKFILTSGEATMRVDMSTIRMERGELYTVNPGQRHSFDIKKGSVLIGLCSHRFDPTDDYK